MILDKKTLENFSYMSLFQVLNLAIPILVYPFLIGKLGKENFGLVIYVQSIMSYFLILMNFGFNITATKLISENRNKTKILHKIVSSIYTIKIIFLLIIFISVGLLIYLIPSLADYKLLVLASLWVCISDLLIPLWYYQGIEKMKFITIYHLLSKIIFVLIILLLLKENKDYLIVPLGYLVGTLVAGVLSTRTIFIKHGIRFQLQNLTSIRPYIIESVPIFISNASAGIFMNINKVLIGSFLGLTSVAYYDLAEKVTNLIRMPQGVISQVLFPKSSSLKSWSFNMKILKITLPLTIVLYLFIFFLASHIVVFLGGHEMEASIVLIKILAISAPIISIGNILGVHTLIPFGYRSKFSQGVVLAGIFHVITLVALYYTNYFSIINVAIACIIAQIMEMVYMFFWCQKNNLFNNKIAVES